MKVKKWKKQKSFVSHKYIPSSLKNNNKKKLSTTLFKSPLTQFTIRIFFFLIKLIFIEIILKRNYPRFKKKKKINHFYYYHYLFFYFWEWEGGASELGWTSYTKTGDEKYVQIGLQARWHNLYSFFFFFFW